MSNQEIKINPEFEELIPKLLPDEFNQLRESILKEGCRDYLVLWEGFLIDGHNRFKICSENNIEFKTINKEFSDINQVKLWMISNQFARRNLNDYQKIVLSQKKKEILLEQGREKKNKNLKQFNNTDLSIMDTSDISHNTRDEIAKDLNWGSGKVARAEVVLKKAPPELKEKLEKSEVSINEAYKEIKAVEKTIELEKKKEEYKLDSIKQIKEKPIVRLMDAIKFLNTFENNSIDLLITDPPYFTDVDDIYKFTQDWLPLALLKIKKSGRAYICSGAYPKEIQAFLNVLLSQDKFIVDSPLIWTYRNTLGVTPKMKYNLNYQMIWHLYSNESKELDTSITNEMFAVQDINAPDGRQGNRLHTWQKPDELALRLIRHSTSEKDLIVDPFCCTGAFLISASKLNRKALGSDNNFENLKIAIERGCYYEKI